MRQTAFVFLSSLIIRADIRDKKGDLVNTVYVDSPWTLGP